MNQTKGWMRRYALSRLASRSARLLTPVILAGLIATGTMSAQTRNQRYDADPTAVKSRAEQAAEQQVALSPEKIIELLRQEPGLLLQVKKMLVRKAYEQGRILDPEDLTDDALFQLLHEDHNICVLATREIEDRAYVRAKPTLEEIEQQHLRNERVDVTRTAAPAAQKPEDVASNRPSQEDAYWEKHDGSTEPFRTDQPQSPTQRMQPVTPAVPQNPSPVNNPQRQVEMTSLPQNSDAYDGMSADSGSYASDAAAMSRIGPEQLPGLLNASSSSVLNTATLDGSAAIRGRTTVQVPNYGVRYLQEVFLRGR